MTDALLEHKKTSEPGIYALFANSMNNESWRTKLKALKADMFAINARLFGEGDSLEEANAFILTRFFSALKDTSNNIYSTLTNRTDTVVTTSF